MRSAGLLLLVVVLAVLLTGGCGAGGIGEGVAAMTPRDGRSGLQLTGTVGGRQLIVTAGAPELLVGDCDPNDGPDDDVCFIASDLDGEVFALVIENPAVLAAGRSVAVVTGCATPEACDAVTDGVVIDLQLGIGDRVPVAGGTLTLDVVEPSQRYAGRVDLELADGRVSGTFDVIPRPDPF